MIRQCGGARATARLIGYSSSSVCKWLKPRTRTKIIGLIPVAAQQRILERAREEGLDITEKDLIAGREVSDE